MNKLTFFTMPKDNLKVRMIEENTALMAEIRAAASDKTVLPDAHDYYNDVLFPDAPVDRPYTMASIVLSSDGKMAFADNPKGPVIAKNNYLDPDGALCDFWVLNMLRAYSDGVIIGARTLQAEDGITSHVYEESLNRQRFEVLGKTWHPTNIVVSFDGTDIPFDHFAFNLDPAERLKMMIGTSPAGEDWIREHSPKKHVFYGPFKDRAEVDAAVFSSLQRDYDEIPVIVTGEGMMPDTALFLYVLRRMGIEKLTVDSPSYTNALMHMGMLDEWFVNYSMLCAGGSTTPGYNAPFAADEHPSIKLVSVGIHGESFLYTRQKLYYGVTEKTDLSGYHY